MTLQHRIQPAAAEKPDTPAASHLLLMVNIARALPQGPQLARFIERSIAVLDGVAEAELALATPGTLIDAEEDPSAPDVEAMALRTARRVYGCLKIRVCDADAFSAVRADLMNALSLVALDLDRRDTLDQLRRSEASLIRRVEERTAELSAKVQENLTLAAIARRTDNAVILTDAQRRIEWVNEGFVRITGYAPEEVIGRSPALLQGPRTDPATVEAMRRALSRGEGFVVDVVNYRKNGEEYWMHVEVQPLRDADGRVSRFMAIERDITQEKWIAELLQAISELQSRFIARLAADRDDGAQTGFADVLDRLTALTAAERGVIARIDPGEAGVGRSPAVELAAATRHDADGAPAWEVWSRHLVEAVRAADGPVLVDAAPAPGDGPPTPGDMAVPRRMLGLPLRQGSHLVGVAGLADRATPFDDQLVTGLTPILSAVANCLVTIQSIEAQRRAVADLKRAKVAAEAADRAKSAFLAQMSHELRTPMNGILGFSELLAEAGDSLPSDKRREYARDIYGAGRHLLDIINDILDFTSLESGKRGVHLEPLDLRETVAQLLRPARGEARRIQLSLRARVPRHLPPVMADARAVRQILLNGLSNAFKFTPAGGRVTICAAAEADGAAVRLIVADTGVGIDADRLDQIFEPFTQMQNPLVRDQTGTGLGLAIVRRLAEAQGGAAWIEGRPGGGTVLTVRLPTVPGSTKHP